MSLFNSFIKLYDQWSSDIFNEINIYLIKVEQTSDGEKSVLGCVQSPRRSLGNMSVSA